MIFMDVTKREISLHKYKILALFRNIYLAETNPSHRNFSLTAQWSRIPAGPEVPHGKFIKSCLFQWPKDKMYRIYIMKF